MSVAITGMGAVTPVGLSAPATAAALRAGIARLGAIASTQVEAEYGERQPATGGRVPLEWLNGGPRDEQWPGHERWQFDLPPPEHWLVPDGPERLIDMAAVAANEARAGRNLSRDWGLFLGLGEDEREAEIAAGVRSALGDWQPRMTEVIGRGRASGLAAVHRAVEEISAKRITGALVGGVDSLVRPSVYERLADAGVIKDADENPQGVNPGEAAAFLVLEAKDGEVLARVRGTGIAEEPTAGTDKPNESRGLVAAIRAARTTLKDRPLTICDLNGDRYRALEWGIALIRALGDLRWRDGVAPADEFWHLADCIGDTGAASGVLKCVWAVESLRKEYSVAGDVLVWGASDGKLRGATVITI